MLIISGPSLILAFIKLRKRNLGPILDANGWAVNAKASINVPFGTSLTGHCQTPKRLLGGYQRPLRAKIRRVAEGVDLPFLCLVDFCVRI